jgi:hypothetical protein
LQHELEDAEDEQRAWQDNVLHLLKKWFTDENEHWQFKARTILSQPDPRFRATPKERLQLHDPTPKTKPIAGGEFVPHAAGCRRWRSTYSAGVRSPSALCGRRWL